MSKPYCGIDKLKVEDLNYMMNETYMSSEGDTEVGGGWNCFECAICICYCTPCLDEDETVVKLITRHGHKLEGFFKI